MSNHRTMLVLCLLVISMAASDVAAQATRTFVSGVGDDVNPCSRTAPCKTFAGAISKTASGGIINALDPGGYGAVTITKSITIDGGGTFAHILASSTNGIVVNNSSNVGQLRVVIRNLTIDGAGGTVSPFISGLNGVRFIYPFGGNLTLENVVIENFTQRGVEFTPNAASQLLISDSRIENATNGGIFVAPGVSGSARVSLDNVTLEKNGLFGLRVEDRSTATVRDSIAAGQGTNGFIAVSNSTTVSMNIEDSVSSNNGFHGIASVGANCTVRITNCTVTNNSGNGLLSLSSGVIETFQNNRIAGNGTNGAPTAVLFQQ